MNSPKQSEPENIQKNSLPPTKKFKKTGQVTNEPNTSGNTQAVLTEINEIEKGSSEIPKSKTRSFPFDLDPLLSLQCNKGIFTGVENLDDAQDLNDLIRELNQLEKSRAGHENSYLQNFSLNNINQQIDMSYKSIGVVKKEEPEELKVNISILEEAKAVELIASKKAQYEESYFESFTCDFAGLHSKNSLIMQSKGRCDEFIDVENSIRQEFIKPHSYLNLGLRKILLTLERPESEQKYICDSLIDICALNTIFWHQKILKISYKSIRQRNSTFNGNLLCALLTTQLDAHQESRKNLFTGSSPYCSYEGIEKLLEDPVKPKTEDQKQSIDSMVTRYNCQICTALESLTKKLSVGSNEPVSLIEKKILKLDGSSYDLGSLCVKKNRSSTSKRYSLSSSKSPEEKISTKILFEYAKEDICDLQESFPAFPYAKFAIESTTKKKLLTIATMAGLRKLAKQFENNCVFPREVVEGFKTIDSCRTLSQKYRDSSISVHYLAELLSNSLGSKHEELSRKEIKAKSKKIQLNIISLEKESEQKKKHFYYLPNLPWENIPKVEQMMLDIFENPDQYEYTHSKPILFKIKARNSLSFRILCESNFGSWPIWLNNFAKKKQLCKEHIQKYVQRCRSIQEMVINPILDYSKNKEFCLQMARYVLGEDILQYEQETLKTKSVDKHEHFDDEIEEEIIFFEALMCQTSIITKIKTLKFWKQITTNPLFHIQKNYEHLFGFKIKNLASEFLAHARCENCRINVFQNRDKKDLFASADNKITLFRRLSQKVDEMGGELVQSLLSKLGINIATFYSDQDGQIKKKRRDPTKVFDCIQTTEEEDMHFRVIVSYMYIISLLRVESFNPDSSLRVLLYCQNHLNQQRED